MLMIPEAQPRDYTKLIASLGEESEINLHVKNRSTERDYFYLMRKTGSFLFSILTLDGAPVHGPDISIVRNEAVPMATYTGGYLVLGHDVLVARHKDAQPEDRDPYSLGILRSLDIEKAVKKTANKT